MNALKMLVSLVVLMLAQSALAPLRQVTKSFVFSMAMLISSMRQCVVELLSRHWSKPQAKGISDPHVKWDN